MTKAAVTNVGASVRQRLLNLSRERHEDFNAAFTQIVADLAEFLEPPRKAAATGSAFEAVWPAAGPWSAR